jgi:UDP-N-acetylglucosamine 3-dehydrogenase
MVAAAPPLRVGVIGFGIHARQVLLPATEQIPEAMRVVALATAREETARAAEQLYRIPCHVGYEALIADPAVEAVINVSSADHEAAAIAALEAGKPVFNETPAIRTEEGAARIRQLSQEKGLTYLVGSCLRYAPVYQKMRALLHAWREEAPGPRMFSASYYFSSSHFHNLMLFLSGPIHQVLHLTAPEGGGTVTLLRFANGDIGSIRDCGFHNWSPPYEQVEIAHQSGLLVAEDGRTLRFHRTPRTVHPTELSFDEADGRLFQTTFSIPYGRNRQLYLRGYVPELAEFVQCVRTGAPPTCGVDDALATLRVGQAARHSRELGGQWADVICP